MHQFVLTSNSTRSIYTAKTRADALNLASNEGLEVAEIHEHEGICVPTVRQVGKRFEGSSPSRFDVAESPEDQESEAQTKEYIITHSNGVYAMEAKSLSHALKKARRLGLVNASVSQFV